MSAIWLLQAFWIGILVIGALWLARWLFSFLVLRFVARAFGDAIGRDALASQPGRIQLEPCGSGAWRDPAAAAECFAPLLDAGFRDTGTFRIAEMPEAVVRLLSNPEEDWIAAVYEHPAAGHWADLVTRYHDGTSATYTTSAETGLDQRPGHPISHHPEWDTRALLDHARRQRPAGSRMPALPEDAAAAFTAAYEDSMRWRKQTGVRAVEVARVAERMKTAA